MNWAKPALIPSSLLSSSGVFTNDLKIVGDLEVDGSSTVGRIDGTLGVFNTAIINSTTNSTTTGNGALAIAGGVGINRDVNIGGNVSITGYVKSSEIRLTGSKLGLATLESGSVEVANTSINSNSRIFLTAQEVIGTPGVLSVVKTDGEKFVINSSEATDESVIAYLIIEAA